MSEELILALEYLEQEKGIDKEKLIQAVEAALLSAARKVLGVKKEELNVTFDPSSGDIKIFLKGEEVSSQELGRIAAQTAKQVIMQKLKEAEKETVYEEYKDRVGDVVLGTVHRKERGDVIVELEKAEALLPKSEQPRGETYRQGQKMKVLIIDVKKSGKPPQVIVSRKSPQLVRKLFEIEVPEIQEGLVEIISIAREAGERTKIAVHSKQENVDPVGSCVGMKGTRVKNIVEELGGEKIDIIRYSDDPKEFLKSALNPAQISEIKLFPDNKKALVIVDKNQLSIAIGRHGQNVRLASHLTGWEIDVRSPEELRETSPLREIEGVGPKLAEILSKSGYDSVEKVANAKVEDLKGIEGIGERTAQRVITSAREYMEKKQQKENE
ncbi:MAG TPA: transcription termination/antitermination protein NusA [Candidatus Omnitrophica bacterium]|nr:transcription termination/antitermination protein NusA [Candidatus Omnitrophota bacterium]